MHRDGEIITDCVEYWPTRELAQAVLGKFQPKPKHAWKHGDVFQHSGCGTTRLDRTMIYLCIGNKPQAVYVHDNRIAGGDVQVYLKGAVFLFNIMEIMEEVVEKLNAL